MKLHPDEPVPVRKCRDHRCLHGLVLSPDQPIDHLHLDCDLRDLSEKPDAR